MNITNDDHNSDTINNNNCNNKQSISITNTTTTTTTSTTSTTTTTNNIRDIIFSNSPLDQYLQSLNDSNNNYLEGEVLSFEDFNQDNIEQNQEQVNNNNNEEENKEIVKNIRKNKSSTNKTTLESSFSDLSIYLLSLYQNVSSIIIDSDLLHPQESPFIQNPNFSLDYYCNNQFDNCDDDDNNDDENHLPPIYPLSLLNISTNSNNSGINNNNNNNNNNNYKLYKFQPFKYLNNIYNNSNNRNNIILILSSIFIIISILIITNPILLISLIIVITLIITSIIKYINNKIQIINNKNEIINKQIKSLIETSSSHYENLMKSIQLIREVELISRGYRLSTPLTPIERLEINNPINSNNNKSEKSFVLRAGVSKSLRTSINLFKQIIDNNFSNNLTTKQKKLYIKSTLSDLYNNIESININDTNNTNNDNNSNNNDSIENELLIMEYCSQLPIITLKMMLHQYQLMVSNFFTILIIHTSNIFYNNNNSNNNNNNILHETITNYINNNNNFDFKILLNLNNILNTLNDLELNLYNLNSRLSIENNSIKSLISKELWENKIPKRVLISKPKKTIVESFIYSTNQIAESLNSISPLFTSLHDKIKPFESNNNSGNKLDQDNNNNDDDDDNSESISILDILKLDEVVNDFIKVKSELNQCLKNWESANKSLVKMVRSIPTNTNLQNKWTEEEANDKLKKLLERLKSHISSHSELIADQDNQSNTNINKFRDYKFTDINSNNDQWQFYEDIGDLDVYIGKELSSTLNNSSNSNNEANEDLSKTATSSSSISAPPPPPLKGLPRKTKPPKRTVFDPDFDPITQTMKCKSSSTSTVSQSNFNNDSNLNLLIPQKKVISELRSVLDIHITKKNLPI